MSFNSEIYERIIESIKISDIKEVQRNLEGVNSTVVHEYFNNEDKYGLKPIHWACLTSNVEILEWMLQEKCDIETSSRNGWRPIHFASFIGNEEMVSVLIRNDCKLDCKTHNGETVLNVANDDCNHKFIDEILNENINLKIGLSMALKCGVDCKHVFCLRSLMMPEYYNVWMIRDKELQNVIQVTDSFSDRKFAIRICKISDFHEYEIRKCIGPNINKILPDLDYSKIRKCYGLIKTETKMIFISEWMGNGTLKNKITQIGPLNDAKIYRYCKDILQAIEFLHDNKILHRFIHPATNVYIDNNGGCKLGLSDYSYSLADGDIQIDDDWLKKYKKYALSAPELVTNGILSYPYDIWLFGCTMIEMSTGNRLNYRFITFDEIDKIMPEIPNEKLQSFIGRMVMKIPTERATASELLNHEFMRNNNYQSIFDNSLIDRKKSIDIIQIQSMKNK